VRVACADTLEAEEFIAAKKATALRVGRKLLAAARGDDPKGIARMVLKGEPVYLDQRPWYARDPRHVIPAEGDTPATNPHLSTTGEDDTNPAASSTGLPQSPPLARAADEMVKADVDWTEAGGRGETALMVAVQAGAVESVRALMGMGADPYRRDASGRNAMDMAQDAVATAVAGVKAAARGAVAARKTAATVLMLVDVRSLADVAKEGDLARARSLLEMGDGSGDAAVNATNEYGMTPLHHAVMARDAAMAELLIRHGANPHARNVLGQTPLSLVDDLDRARARAEMTAAFEGGKGDDAVRRAKDAERLAASAAEQELLRVFERKLRTLTRGTAAAKTLSVLTKMTAHAVRARPPRARSAAAAGARLSHSGPSLVQKRVDALVRPPAPMPADTSLLATATPPANPFSVDMVRSRPGLPGTAPMQPTRASASPAGRRPAGPGTLGTGLGLYQASASRHVTGLVALNARAGVGATGADEYAEFYSAGAPPANDRRFDVWFMSHTRPGAK